MDALAMSEFTANAGRYPPVKHMATQFPLWPADGGFLMRKEWRSWPLKARRYICYFAVRELVAAEYDHDLSTAVGASLPQPLWDHVPSCMAAAEDCKPAYVSITVCDWH